MACHRLRHLANTSDSRTWRRSRNGFAAFFFWPHIIHVVRHLRSSRRYRRQPIAVHQLKSAKPGKSVMTAGNRRYPRIFVFE